MRYQICKKGVIRVVGMKTPLTEEHEDNMKKLPDIEVYPLEGTGLGTLIKEIWFAVRQLHDDETPQNVS